MKSKKWREEKLRQDFLPEALELVEKPAAPWGHMGIFIICIVVIAMLIWSLIGKIDITVTARGKIAAGGDKGIQKIQSENGGSVEKIHVKEGDQVQKGEILVTLSSDTEKDVKEYNENFQEELKYREKLILKIQSGQKLDREDQKSGEIYSSVYDYLVSVQNQGEEKIREARLEAESADKELEGMKKMLSQLKRDEKDYEELYQGGAVARREWQEKSDERKQQEQAVLTAQIKCEALKSALSETENEYKKEISSLLVECRKELREGEVRTDQSNREYDEKYLKAPTSGTVKSILVNTEGGVVAPAQEIMEIIPKEDEMIMELIVFNQDIGYIRKGQEVSIKFDTYDYQEYGKLEGEVIYISPDTFQHEQLGEVYTVQARLAKETMNKKYEAIDWQGGVQGTAEIKVGERRIINFFVEPMNEHFDGSLNTR